MKRVSAEVLKKTDPNKISKVWISPADLIQLFRKSMLANVKFGVYYGVSNNHGRLWNIKNARRELGYKPVDNASTLIK